MLIILNSFDRISKYFHTKVIFSVGCMKCEFVSISMNIIVVPIIRNTLDYIWFDFKTFSLQNHFFSQLYEMTILSILMFLKNIKDLETLVTSIIHKYELQVFVIRTQNPLIIHLAQCHLRRAKFQIGKIIGDYKTKNIFIY